MKFVLSEKGMAEVMPNLNPMGKDGWLEGWLTREVQQLFQYLGDVALTLCKYALINAGPILMVVALAACVLRIMGMKKAGPWVWWSIMAYLIAMFIKEVSGL